MCGTAGTTHYMEEVERLCQRAIIMDHGRIIALISFGTLGVCWLFAILVFDVRVHGSWAGFVLVNAAAALFSASIALMRQP